MTTEELYNLEEFDLFISEAEEKWLTFFPKNRMVEIFFGSIENAHKLFEMHKNNEEIWDFDKNNFK